MKRYESKWNIAADIVAGLFILWILFFRWNDVQGNLEASVVWGYPSFVIFTEHLKRKMENNKNDSN